MLHRPLDTYDAIPPAMRNYLAYYGFHFSKRAYEYAASQMRKRNPSTGKAEKVEPWTREKLNDLLAKYGIVITGSTLYDAAYVAHMARCDFLGSSIPDEAHLCLFVKDYIEDPDASDETAFRRWLATEIGNGNPIDFADII